MELVTINPSQTTKQFQTLSPNDRRLVSVSNINGRFGDSQDRIEIHIYDEIGSILNSDYDATDYYPELVNSKNSSYSSLLLDPEKDLKNRGYSRGNLSIQYNFYKNLFNSSFGIFYWIKEISTSRTEIKLASQNISDSSIRSSFADYQNYISTKNYYPVFYLNFGNNRTLIATNVALTQDNEGSYLIVKLYEPLPDEFALKTQLWIVDKVGDPVSFNVNIQIESSTNVYIDKLRGPNFNVEISTKAGQTTPYYNYNNLIVSPVTSSYQKLRSFYQDKAVELNVDYSNFSNFIHFSSAVQRVNNFVYKLQLIQSASFNIAVQSGMVSGGVVASSSITAEQKFIDSTIKNFDIYEYFLYFDSSSWAWPKRNSVQPYELYSVTSSEAANFLGSENLVPNGATASLLFSASYYDSFNKDILHNTTPQYILDDYSNQPYITFLDMIGQHFDNIWVYYKDVSNRYDATNNPNTGISLDLVSDALRGLGMQLYTNTNVSDNLYYTMFGINPDGSLLPPTGSEWITNYVTSSIATLPAAQIQDEIYKRLYHNLPYLLKTKGTQRGIKNLIQSYGIPESMLKIREFGGNITTALDGVLDLDTSEYKITIDTGSFENPSFVMSEVLEYIIGEDSNYIVTDEPVLFGSVTGSLTVSSSLLSPYTTVQYYVGNRRLNSTNVEIGFSPSDTINANISSSQGLFNIDQLIGSPGYQYSASYEPLVSASNAYFSSYTQPNSVWEYIRLLKFYNNSLFKLIKDFVPARVNVSTGIIIKSHLYERNKYARHEPSMSVMILSQSIKMDSITGSSGGALLGDTDSSGYVMTIDGPAFFSRTDDIEKYNGELSGSYVVVTSGRPFPQTEVSQLPAPFTYNQLIVSESGADYITAESDGPPPFPDYNGDLMMTEDQIGNPFYIFPIYALYQNVTASVRSQVLFDLDYTGDQLTPINYGIVTYSISQSQVNNYATYTNKDNPYAEVQDYNYNLQRSLIPRYEGSKTISSTYNDFTNGDQSYGQTAAIDKIKYQYAYIVNIFSSSFQMPYRAKGQIKYIIDNNQNVLNLSKTSTNWFAVQNIFKAGESADVSLFDYDPNNPYIQRLNNSDNDFTIWESGYSYSPLMYNNSGSLTYLLDQLITIPGTAAVPSTTVNLSSSSADYWSFTVNSVFTPGGIAVLCPITASSRAGGAGSSTAAVTVTYYLTLGGLPFGNPTRYPSSGNSTVIIPAGTSPSSYKWTEYLGSSYSSWVGNLPTMNIVSETTGSAGTPAGSPTITSASTDFSTAWTVVSPGNVVLMSATQSEYYGNFTSTGSYAGLEAFVFPFNVNNYDLVRLYNYSTSRWDQKGEFRVQSVNEIGINYSGSNRIALTLDRTVPIEYTSGSSSYPLSVYKYLLLKRLNDETSVYFNYNLPQSIEQDGTLFPQYIGEGVKEESGNVIKALKQQNLI